MLLKKRQEIDSAQKLDLSRTFPRLRLDALDCIRCAFVRGNDVNSMNSFRSTCRFVGVGFIECLEGLIKNGPARVNTFETPRSIIY